MSIEKSGFKITKRVTLPLFKIAPNKEFYFLIEGAMFIGKDIADKSPDAKKKEPATLMHVTDLISGEIGQIICGSVLRGIFNDEYPTDSYVGKKFCIEMHKITGKDYNGYSVTEIEEADEATEAAAPVASDEAGTVVVDEAAAVTSETAKRGKK